MNNITHVEGRGIVVEGSDIDTDQIIPARYMKMITFEGIEKYAFYDVRYDAQGNEKDHPFNDAKYTSASILIVNSNFGCGSSREHAPQTLMRSGIQAILGESFAEIFAGNCTALGLPVVCLAKEDILAIQGTVKHRPSIEIRVNICDASVFVGDVQYKAYIATQVQHALAEGTWDTTQVMLAHETEIERVYNSLPYIS